jgi:ABC-type branched-subunit amino acid transport system substrate-binding protein
VLGPALSTASLAAGPIYAAAGLASLTTTATSDDITQNRTTFRVVFKNSEQGEILATYLSRVLGLSRAAVIVVDSRYGQSLRKGFEETAPRLGIAARYFVFKTEEEGDEIAHRIAADSDTPAVVFLSLDGDAARILTSLRRAGAKGPFLGCDALGDESFSARFADLREERRQPGYFSEGVYGISPMILDSANADTLEFAAHFRARFGYDPSWFAAAGYDAARLAVSAVRDAAAHGLDAETALPALRAGILDYLMSRSSPARSVPGLLGALWFDGARGRQQAIRIGRFNRGRFESAPLQIVPVTTPAMTEVASGAVFEIASGRYARMQRVVYTGVYVNEIPRVDLSRSSFGADFYLWLRFARDAGPDAADPTDISFPNLISGGFDRANPAEQGRMPDGTEYRLWRVQGEFRNDFDLHRFPFDRQVLSLPLFNARAAADRIVYVLDKRSSPGPQYAAAELASGGEGGGALIAGAARADPVGGGAFAEPGSPVSPVAFRNLTQWRPLGTGERRENLVTESALGDPRHVGVESHRELSGFLVSIALERRAIATLAKSLLPLFLMTLIMYASLHFPVALVKEKVTVAVTGALSGAVLLTAINSQLGNIGYTIAIEYAFFVFFGLSLLCIVAVLGAERLRAAGRIDAAIVTEHATRILFLIGAGGTLCGGAALWLSGP